MVGGGPPGLNPSNKSRGGGRGNKANDAGGGGKSGGKPTGGKASTSGRGPKGDGGGGRSSGKDERQEAPSNTDELRKLWVREKRCLGCGSENHFIRECPIAPTSSKSSGSSKRPGKGSASKGGSGEAGKAKPHSSKGKAGPAQSGVKRSRDHMPSGLTPPAKRPSTQKFSYAEAAAGAVTMVILTKENHHISKQNFQTIQEAVETEWFRILDEGAVPFHVEKWSYTLSLATVSFLDQEAHDKVVGLVKSKGFNCMRREELEAMRKPTKILSGLLSGPVAKRTRQELERLLKFGQDKYNIHGRMEYYTAIEIPRSGNKLLRIKVDSDAEEGMKELNYELPLGASGKVRFEDESANKKLTPENKRRKLEELEAKISEEKSKIEELVKQRIELDKAEVESVGSLGLSGLEMAEGTKDPKAGNTAPEAME